MRRLRINPLKPRELDRTAMVLGAWAFVIAVAWGLAPPWWVLFGAILLVQGFSVELLRRHYRDIREREARQRADRAG